MCTYPRRITKDVHGIAIHYIVRLYLWYISKPRVWPRKEIIPRLYLYMYRPPEKSLTARVVNGIKRPCTATVVVKHDIYIYIYCYKTTVSVTG